MPRPKKSKEVFETDVESALCSGGSAYETFVNVLSAYRDHWKLSEVARKTGYRAQTLSAILYKQQKVAANFSTVETLLDAMGFELRIVRKECHD